MQQCGLPAAPTSPITHLLTCAAPHRVSCRASITALAGAVVPLLEEFSSTSLVISNTALIRIFWPLLVYSGCVYVYIVVLISSFVSMNLIRNGEI